MLCNYIYDKLAMDSEMIHSENLSFIYDVSEVNSII